MGKDSDWYPQSLAGERALYANIKAKIAGYEAKYPAVLTDDYLLVIDTFCNAFIEAYDKIEQNRATNKQATSWFENLCRSKQENTPAPSPPIYQAITIPANTLVGIEKACRDFAGLLKKQLNYNEADGVDLMIEKEKADDLVLEDAQPDLKLSVSASNVVEVEWKKSGFDMLELQYRKFGETLWQPADKSTEKIIEFAPPLTTPGTPEKFEFRGIYLIKNQRVGQWSAVYTVTVG